MRLQEPVEDGNEREIHKHECQISSGRSPSSILIALIRSPVTFFLIYNRSQRHRDHVNETALITYTKLVSVPRTFVNIVLYNTNLC